MNYRYGLLKSSALNLGDEIQSVIVKKLLPRVDEYVDGCYLHQVKSEPRMKLIIHGCFNSNSGHWPQSEDIKPLFISFHIGEYTREAYTQPHNVEYLKQYEPIGCRDLYTLEIVQSKGIKAYFSGCITSLLEPYTGKRTEEILLTDLEPNLVKPVKQIITNAIEVHHGEGLPVEEMSGRLRNISPILFQAVKASRIHRVLGLIQQNYVRSRTTNVITEYRMARAEALLFQYARAKLVITSRLHAALPCVAFGTPVIFVHRDLNSPRFLKLLDCVPTYSVEEFKRRIKRAELDVPTFVSKPVNGLRENLLHTYKKFIKTKKYK